MPRLMPLLLLVVVVVACSSQVTESRAPSPTATSSVPAPNGFSVVKHSEGAIWVLRWSRPDSGVVTGYEIEWRLADVPHWTRIQLEEFESSSNTPRDALTVRARGPELTSGYVEVEHCYRMRFVAGSGRTSEWSPEDCAYNGNYFWSGGAWDEIASRPGTLPEWSIEQGENGVAVSWHLSFTEWTAAVEVWRRSSNSADYETVARVEPEADVSFNEIFPDPPRGEPAYCYRLVVVNDRGQSRPYDDVCPQA